MNCIKHFDTSRRITTTPAITVRPLSVSENIARPSSKRSERRELSISCELRRFTHLPGCGLWLVDAMTKYYLGTRRLELQCIKVAAVGVARFKVPWVCATARLCVNGVASWEVDVWSSSDELCIVFRFKLHSLHNRQLYAIVTVSLPVILQGLSS